MIHGVEFDRFVSYHVRNALDHHKAIIACMLGCTDMLDLYCEKSLDKLRNISFIPIDHCKDALSLKKIIKNSDSDYDNDRILYALLSVDER